MSKPETDERFANCHFCKENGIVAHLMNTASNHRSISCTLLQFYHPGARCPFDKLVQGLLSPHGSIIVESRPTIFSKTLQLVPFTETQTQKRGYEVQVAHQVEGSIVVETPLDVLRPESDLKIRFTKFVSDCQAQHSTCDVVVDCSPLLPEAFVVDVVQKCLAKAPPSPRYIALSYVWGGAEQFNTTTRNLEELQRPGALEAVRSLISQVILDAMEFVALVGERYLWVDTLCIVQDDDEFKGQQLKRMGAIYARSLACICAIAGRDAGAGLPGIRADSAPLQRARIGENADIVAMRPNLRSQLQDSVYETRAWTYQERIMAPRLIFFTDWTIHFDCWRSRGLYNPLHDLLGTGVESFHGLEQNKQELRFFEAYGRLVEEYSQRRLRSDRPEDRALAAAGLWEITSHYLTSEFYSGICSRFLEFSLLWVGTDKDDLSGPMVFVSGYYRNKACPSWSWAGVLNPVSYDFSVGLLRVLHTCDYKFQSRIHSVVYEVKDPNGIRPIISLAKELPGAYVVLSFHATIVCCNCDLFGYIQDEQWTKIGITRSFVVQDEKLCGVIYSEHLNGERVLEGMEFAQVARLEAPDLEGVDEDDWPCEMIFEPLVPSDFLQGEHLVLVLCVKCNEDNMERIGCGMFLETAWNSAQGTETSIRLF